MKRKVYRKAQLPQVTTEAEVDIVLSRKSDPAMVFWNTSRKMKQPSVAWKNSKRWLKQRSNAFTESERVRFASAQGNANLGVPVVVSR